MIFENDEPDVREAYFALWDKLDGTQKCADDPDSYTENWTGRPIPDEVAQRMCAGCKFIEECKTYARVAGE